MLRIIFTEGELQGEYLEVGREVSVPITYSISDVRDITKRSTTYSKNFDIVGSKHNNRLMNHYYDIRVEPLEFDAKKSYAVALEQEGVTIIDNMYLNLQDVVIDSKGVWLYKVNLNTSTADFYSSITDGELRDLPIWEDFTHVFNFNTITPKMLNTTSDSYKYIIPYITDSNYYIGELIPSTYVRAILDSIHIDKGVSYEIEDSGFNLDDLIITSESYIEELASDISDEYEIITTSNIATPPLSIPNHDNTLRPRVLYTYNDVPKDNMNKTIPNDGYRVSFDILETLTLEVEVDEALVVEVINEELEYPIAYPYTQLPNIDYIPLRVSSIVSHNGNVLSKVPIGVVSSITDFYRWRTEFDYDDKIIKTALKEPAPPPSQLQSSSEVPPNTILEFIKFEGVTKHSLGQGSGLVIGDIIKVEIQLEILTEELPPGSSNPQFLLKDTNAIPPNVPGFKSTPNGTYRARSLEKKVTMRYNIENQPPIGSTIKGEYLAPKEVTQSAFIKSLVLMFNLYIEEDRNIKSKLRYVTRDRYYAEGKEVDWSKALIRDKDIRLSYIPHTSNKYSILNYKSSTEDFALEAYKKETGKDFGQIRVRFSSEQLRGEDISTVDFGVFASSKTIFNAITPIIPFEGRESSILYTKNNIPSSSYRVRETSAPNSPRADYTSYPYAGIFDTPNTPSKSIEFGQSDFYGYTPNNLTLNNLYNKYWQNTFRQLDEGKLLVAYFRLTEREMSDFRLSDTIVVDNEKYYVNKIIDYDANGDGITKVELITKIV